VQKLILPLMISTSVVVAPPAAYAEVAPSTRSRRA
jgi:hypothetical protein